MVRSPGTTSRFGDSTGLSPRRSAASSTSAPRTSSSSVVVHAPMNTPCRNRPACFSTGTTLSGENGTATSGPSAARSIG